jgi:hypothetical protein
MLPSICDDYIDLSELAPCGKGSETVIDPTIRNAYHIKADEFIMSKRWFDKLEKIAAQCAHDMGVSGPTKLVTHEILMYKKNGHFKRHQDTEKCLGMFGTFVVSLPSWHQGGDLLIQHGSDAKVWETSGAKSIEDTQYVAFYADCYHELLPITKGRRIVMVFNMCRDVLKTSIVPSYPGPGITVSCISPKSINTTDKSALEPIPVCMDHPRFKSVSSQVMNLASTWPVATRDEPLIVVLHHKYITSKDKQLLDWTTLKGNDSVVVALLRSIPDVHLYLAQAQIETDMEFDLSETLITSDPVPIPSLTMIGQEKPCQEFTKKAPMSFYHGKHVIMDHTYWKEAADKSDRCESQLDCEAYLGNESMQTGYQYSRVVVLIYHSTFFQQ